MSTFIIVNAEGTTVKSFPTERGAKIALSRVFSKVGPMTIQNTTTGAAVSSARKVYVPTGTPRGRPRKVAA